MTTFTRLEKCLLPPSEIVHWNGGDLRIEQCTTSQKIAHCTKNFFIFTVLLLIAPLTLIYDCFAQKQITPLQNSPDKASPSPAWPPTERGFATSFFQNCGLGTKWSATPGLTGKCDWDKWMDKQEHVIHPDGFDYKDFFTDVLSDPTVYIDMLKAHNVTAHRFSLEWSVLEPRKGKTSSKAIELYRNFVEKLIEAGIKPSITLSHFVVPEWFYEDGNFQKLENIDLFVDFSLRAMNLFPEVKDWWSFNELGVKAFQQTREVYPTDLPEGSFLPKRVHAAGISTRNMLIAHCKLHQKVQELHPDKKVGVTHQWLTFDMATGNWLERLFSYIFTKFGFTPVYQFFKDGRYSFEFPFMANIQFQIPKEEFEQNNHFLARLGVQAYPKPMLKMGLNHGQTYPGRSSAIQNLPFFSFGSTCEPGGIVSWFGPRQRAEAMDEILDQAFDLTDQVYITEFGSDAMVHKWGEAGFYPDNEVQANHLRQLTERIQDYSKRTFREIKGIYCWSDLRRQMEWENGFQCKLAIVEPILNKHRHMVDWKPTPASEYLREAYEPKISQNNDLSA